MWVPNASRGFVTTRKSAAAAKASIAISWSCGLDAFPSEVRRDPFLRVLASGDCLKGLRSGLSVSCAKGRNSSASCVPLAKRYIVLNCNQTIKGNKLMSNWNVLAIEFPRNMFVASLAFIALCACVMPSLGFAQQAEEEEQTEQSEESIEATELEQAPVVPLEEIEEVVVTGSRLQRTPGELAGNLITLDEDYIRSTGEVTLERVLRQLPQNSNPSQERFGSNLNSATNFSGASTVNLRGLGSESTLILIDGKRIGHSGLLGGVSDVSEIPLAMVERIEVLLDGASAIYGSDAVGGVVNIITKKDYQGVLLELNYNWPSEDGYEEIQGSVSGGFSLGDNTRIRASVQRNDHSGMDAADRNVTLFQQSIFSGPQYDLRFCCLSDGSSLPILWRLDGDVLTRAEFFALSAEDKARATEEHYAILPQGFNENSSVDEITEFRKPSWGAETQSGYSVLPEAVRDSLTFNVEQDFGLNLSAALRVRYENRDTVYERGYVTFNGETFGSANSFNQFGGNVHIRGQRRDMPSPRLETESETFDIGLDFEGVFGDSGWEWEAGFGRVTRESETLNMNVINREVLRPGLSSRVQNVYRLSEEDCLARGGTYTPERLSWGILQPSRCAVPPPPAINPFGDLSPYLDTLMASSTNEQSRFEALVRGDLFALPGGDVRLLVGYSWKELVLESATDFQAGLTYESPTGAVDNFDTDAERSNQAMFFESLLPIVGAANSRPGIDRLSLSLSGRWDSYDEPSVVFNLADEGPQAAEDLSDPGEEFTWGLGVNFTPVSDLRVRINKQTAFVAPQLNQVIVATGIGPSQPFQGLFIQLPGGALQQREIRVIEGGNSDLKSETAETLSFGFELTPRFVAGLGFKATWSETEYKDRINRLSNFIIDPNNLPSGTTYDPVEDLYTQERRWINVSSINREGVDYDLYYERATNIGQFGLQVRHSRTTEYEFVVDPTAGDESISVLSHTEGSTAVGVVPRSATNAQLSWRHRGLDISVDISSTDETSRSLGGVTRTYTPPQLLDLTLSYEFGAGGLLPSPAFLDGGRITFRVNNLTDDFGESKGYTSTGEQIPQSSPDPSPLYGRVFSLSYRMSFGEN